VHDGVPVIDPREDANIRQNVAEPYRAVAFHLSSTTRTSMPRRALLDQGLRNRSM
jgi:hypothetical protein